MSKQDRQGSRTPAQLKQEFNFGKSFAVAMGLANEAKDEARKATENNATTESKVLRLDDRINITVKKTEEIKEIADSAQKTANEAKAEITAQYTIFDQRADEVDISVTKLREEIGTKAEQSQVDEITEHFRFAEDGLTITNSGTGMGIGVSEERVIFTGGNDPTTVIRPNDMETTNLAVKTQLDLGGFSWIPRTNKNLSLRWTGG